MPYRKSCHAMYVDAVLVTRTLPSIINVATVKNMGMGGMNVSMRMTRTPYTITLWPLHNISPPVYTVKLKHVSSLGATNKSPTIVVFVVEMGMIRRLRVSILFIKNVPSVMGIPI